MVQLVPSKQHCEHRYVSLLGFPSPTFSIFFLLQFSYPTRVESSWLAPKEMPGLSPKALRWSRTGLATWRHSATTREETSGIWNVCHLFNVPKPICVHIPLQARSFPRQHPRISNTLLLPPNVFCSRPVINVLIFFFLHFQNNSKEIPR